MLNREKYGNEIIELAVNKGMFCIKNGEPVLCEETECKDCDFHESDSCKGSTYNFREWLNSEYVEPPVDWTKVPVDTPILVRGHENREWTRRHFAKSKTERCLHGVVGQHLGARMMKRLFRGNMPSWQKVRNRHGEINRTDSGWNLSKRELREKILKNLVFALWRKA